MGFSSEPSLRSAVLRYLSSLPFSSAVAKTFFRLYADTEIYDDVTTLHTPVLWSRGKYPAIQQA